MKLKTLSFLAAALLSPAAFAQQVQFKGQVEDVQGTQNQFFVDCTAVDLISPGIDLNPLIGFQTEITGQWNGSFTDPVVTVTAIEVVPESFEVGGSGEIGKSLTFGVNGQPGAFALAFFSPGNGFFPAADGAFLLDVTSVFLIGAGQIHGDGMVEWPLPIPDDTSLVGLTVYGQGGRFDAATGFFEITNSDCKTLEDH